MAGTAFTIIDTNTSAATGTDSATTVVATAAVPTLTTLVGFKGTKEPTRNN